MVRKQPLGLMDYLLLSEEERDFYTLTGRLPSERPEDVKIEITRTKPPINKGGRPRKTYHIDERRAYCLWLIAKEMPEEARAKITNRKLIEIAHTMPFRGLFTSSQQTLETSVFRGKKTLKIDNFWNSKVCVLLAEDIPKLQS
jgi:hypothetical protein